MQKGEKGRGEWMKNLSIIVALLATLMCLSGCSLSTDIFGATDRAQIRADAAIQVAQAQRDQAIGVAHEQASSSRAWAGTLPIVVLIVVVGAIAGIVVNWQGRIYYEHAKRPVTQLPQQQFIEIPERVHQAAIQRGGYPEWDGERWLIVDGSGRVLARQRMITG
jgi:hypothetical protein